MFIVGWPRRRRETTNGCYSRNTLSAVLYFFGIIAVKKNRGESPSLWPTALAHDSEHAAISRNRSGRWAVSSPAIALHHFPAAAEIGARRDRDRLTVGPRPRQQNGTGWNQPQLAPVLDVNSNPQNPIIGDRSSVEPGGRYVVCCRTG